MHTPFCLDPIHRFEVGILSLAGVVCSKRRTRDAATTQRSACRWPCLRPCLRPCLVHWSCEVLRSPTLRTELLLFDVFWRQLELAVDFSATFGLRCLQKRKLLIQCDRRSSLYNSLQHLISQPRPEVFPWTQPRLF